MLTIAAIIIWLTCGFVAAGLAMGYLQGSIKRGKSEEFRTGHSRMAWMYFASGFFGIITIALYPEYLEHGWRKWW